MYPFFDIGHTEGPLIHAPALFDYADNATGAIVCVGAAEKLGDPPVEIRHPFTRTGPGHDTYHCQDDSGDSFGHLPKPHKYNIPDEFCGRCESCRMGGNARPAAHKQRAIPEFHLLRQKLHVLPLKFVSVRLPGSVDRSVYRRTVNPGLFSSQWLKFPAPLQVPQMLQFDRFSVSVGKSYIANAMMTPEQQTPDVIVDRIVASPAGVIQVQIGRHGIGVFGPCINPGAIEKNRNQCGHLDVPVTWPWIFRPFGPSHKTGCIPRIAVAPTAQTVRAVLRLVCSADPAPRLARTSPVSVVWVFPVNPGRRTVSHLVCRAGQYRTLSAVPM